MLAGLLLGWLFFALPVQAQLSANDIGLDYASQSTFGGNNDLREVIGNVIKIVLGFLGIVVMAVMAYGGSRWIIAAGDPDKIESAKKILFMGLIGLVIIISAYSITLFIINGLARQTIGDDGTGSGQTNTAPTVPAAPAAPAPAAPPAAIAAPVQPVSFFQQVINFFGWIFRRRR